MVQETEHNKNENCQHMRKTSEKIFIGSIEITFEIYFSRNSMLYTYKWNSKTYDMFDNH